MASHIADFMVETSDSTVGLNNYIARELSPHAAKDFVRYTIQHSARVWSDKIQSRDTTSSDEKDKHVWRMQPTIETRKYQLFPAVDRLSVMVAKIPEQESLPNMTSATSNVEKPLSNALRKTKEPSLVRRRKISVPELGPMTTVQEVAMDSRKHP